MRIKFFQSFGSLAKIEGVMSADGNSLNLEMAMTRSVSEPVSGILKRSVAFVELEDVLLIRRFWGGRDLQLVARTLEAFANIPGASGFKYRVRPTNPKKEVRAFVTDARLAIAQAAMDKFSEQIEHDLGE